MKIPPQRQLLYIITIFIFAFAFLSNWQFYNSIKIDYYWQQQQQQQNAPLRHQGDEGATISSTNRLLDVKDDELRSLFQGVCKKVDVQRKRYLGGDDDDDDCILQKVVSDPKEDINDCTPFEGGSNNLFGLKWCAWTPKEDGLSSNVLQSIVPSMEKAPIEAFQSSFLDKPRGIVIDAGAQIGLFSAAALAAGHYTISIDARPEHAQMNMVSRRLNNMTSMECGFVVSGALADRCGNRWATIPREVQKQNPGGTNIVGRVSDGYPFFATREQFAQLYAVPILTLDYIVDKALQHLPDNVERKVYALKIDIEGYEPLALLGALRMLSKLQPDVIVMELFMGRSIDCSLHQLIKSLAKMGYSIDALDRISWHQRKRLDCDGKNTCTNLTWGSTGLDNFLTRLHGRAEMDLIMSKVNNNNNRSIVA